MMLKSAVAAIALCACASSVSAQGFGIGAHVGTTGVGGDVAFSLSDRLALRGSLGTIPVKPTFTLSDLEFEIEPPSTLMTLGIDLFPGAGSFHISGGVLTGAEKTNILGNYTGTVQVGDSTFTGAELGTLEGAFETSNAAPYVTIGFGRHTGSGFGLVLDLGVAFMGESSLSLTAPNSTRTGPAKARLDEELDKERAAVEEDLRKVTKLFPMLNIGIRIGM